jgi:hypothetical protein
LPEAGGEFAALFGGKGRDLVLAGLQAEDLAQEGVGAAAVDAVAGPEVVERRVDRVAGVLGLAVAGDAGRGAVRSCRDAATTRRVADTPVEESVAALLQLHPGPALGAGQGHCRYVLIHGPSPRAACAR